MKPIIDIDTLLNTVICGDCLEVMKYMPDRSVDCVVTDPPYELGFMGKSWDNTGIANNVEMWKECLRVLKPGGYLLSFSGTRTYHRQAVAIEDAGFEVRDMIEWCYGSGFPKSLNIGKAIDKMQGNEREIVGETRIGKTSMGDASGWDTSENMKAIKESGSVNITKGTSQYEGWGTALKPAHEPICMARKPLSEKTVALNVLKWGTGGINIDESRVGFVKGDEPSAGNRTATFGNQETISGGDGSGGFESNNLGRFPANLIHDNSEEVRECFPETKSQSGGNRGKTQIWGSATGEQERNGFSDSGNASRFFKSIPENKKSMWFNHGEADGTGVPQGPTYNDNGNASRFFKSIIYTAKASKSERNKGCEGLEKGCSHPTVKPIALMEYLIKMVTPKDGIVLDPFAGSGSTLVAAKQNGYNYIGIELTPEYIPIIEARLNAVKDIQEVLL